LIEVGLSRGD